MDPVRVISTGAGSTPTRQGLEQFEGISAESVLWEQLKSLAPELFVKKTTPPANAGQGSGTPSPAAKSMNELLRGR